MFRREPRVPPGALSALLMLLTFTVCAPSADAKSPWAEAYDPQQDAAPALQTALQEAAESDRLLLVIVGGDWCPWCFTLDRYFQRHDGEREAVEETFVVFKLFFVGGHPNEALLARFPGIRGYPHFMVFDPLVGYVGAHSTGALENKRKVRGDSYDRRKMRGFVAEWETYRRERIDVLAAE